MVSTNFVQNWCVDDSSSSNAGVITSSRPRNAVTLSIRTIGTIVASSAAGIGDWNAGERSSTGVVLAVYSTQNYASWAIARPTDRIRTCDRHGDAHHNMSNRLSQGKRAGTAWFGRSLRPMEGVNRYGVFSFRLTLGWRLCAPCAMKKHGTIVLK